MTAIGTKSLSDLSVEDWVIKMKPIISLKSQETERLSEVQGLFHDKSLNETDKTIERLLRKLKPCELFLTAYERRCALRKAGKPTDPNQFARNHTSLSDERTDEELIQKAQNAFNEAMPVVEEIHSLKNNSSSEIKIVPGHPVKHTKTKIRSSPYPTSTPKTQPQQNPLWQSPYSALPVFLDTSVQTETKSEEKTPDKLKLLDLFGKWSLRDSDSVSMEEIK